jgi:hypothetical protein
MKCKFPIQANSHKNHLFPLESVRWTLSAPTELCPTGLEIVWISNLSPMTRSLRELYKYPYFSNGSLSLGHSNLLVLKLISFISKGQKHSTLELPQQVLDLGIEWSQDPSFVCESHLHACLGTWIFICYACYYWSFAPRRLEVALELLLCVVSLGKFVLPLCDSDHLSEQRAERDPALCERLNEDVGFFGNSNLGINLVSLVSLCLLLCCCYIYLLVEPIL